MGRYPLLEWENGGRSPAIEIIAPRLVALGQMPFVRIDIAREAACDGPDGAGIEHIQQCRVRHEAGDAAVAVEEGMNPRETVMRGVRDAVERSANRIEFRTTEIAGHMRWIEGTMRVLYGDDGAPVPRYAAAISFRRSDFPKPEVPAIATL